MFQRRDYAWGRFAHCDFRLGVFNFNYWQVGLAGAGWEASRFAFNAKLRPDSGFVYCGKETIPSRNGRWRLLIWPRLGQAC